jgi:hypothetical protein
MWVTDREEGGETYQQLRMESAGRTADIGSPEIPYVGRWVGVPHGAEVSARVVALDSMDLYGYQIWPAQEPLPDMDGVEPGPFERDEVAYGGKYPDGVVRVSEKKVVRGCEVALIGVFPLQYDAAEGHIRVYRRMRVEVSFSGGAGYFVEPRLRSRFFEPLYAGILLNHGEFEGYDPLGAPRDGEGEMIILVPDGLASAVQQLAQWRTMSGLPTVVTTLTEAGGDTAGIRQYIRDAYEQWETPPSFVLMVGDADLMPTEYKYTHPYHGTPTGTDLWYFTVDGSDQFADIHHARLSVENGIELAATLGQILAYEKTPLTGNWNNHVFLAAYEEPGRYFTITSDAVYNYLITLGYDCDRAYQNGNPPGSTTDVINNWNEGCFIVNHRDHGDTDGWSHPAFTNSHLSQLTNGMMLPVVYSLNCLTGYFDSETDQSGGTFESFCEMLSRLNPGGCIGVLGATRVSYSGYNDELCKGLYDAMFPGFDPGYPGMSSQNPWEYPTFQQGTVTDFAKWWMYDKYVLTGGAGYPWSPDPTITRIEFEMFHYHGDPSQDIHSAEPTAMVVSHDAATVVAVPSFTVYADEEGGLVALSIDGDLIGREYVSGGMAEVVFDTPPTEPGVMDVVVTAHNRIPYEAEVNIAPADGWYVVIDSVMTDDYWGHVDGTVEQGDSVGIGLRLWNVGQQQAPSVTGVLSSSDGAVSIALDTQAYGTIPADGMATSPGDYLIAVAGGTLDCHIVPFELAVTSGDSIWTRSFTLMVHAPDLGYVGYLVDDSAGNNDGRPDPGETVDLRVTLTNSGSGTAASLQGDLSCSSPYATILASSVSYPDMAPGDSVASTGAFQVEFDASTPIGFIVPFTLDLAAFGPYQAQIGFTVVVGQPPVLFVDSDDEPHETRLVDALDASGYSYETWEAFTAGSVPLTTLELYDVVVWTAGDQNTQSMSATDRINMGQYLDQGGSLLFTAENYLTAYGSDAFTTDYLHVASYTTSVTVDTVKGVLGDPVSDGLALATDFPAALSNYPDEIVPDGQATALLTIGSSSDATALRYPASGARDYRVIFMATPFEALEPGLPDPNNPETFLKSALAWLIGAADTIPPNPISDLTAGLGSPPTNLVLTWSAPWDNVGVDHYNVYRDTTAYFEIGPSCLAATVAFTTWTDMGAAGNPSVNHYYTVTAVDASENEAPASNRVGELDCLTSTRGAAARSRVEEHGSR